jgi:hypothetical protein
VQVELAVTVAATAPVVTGRLPGVSDEDVLLCAHLCHAGPGANDNASGVAALLGVAAILAGGGGRHRPVGDGRGLRFVWGPEFVGLAAHLHRQAGLGRAAPAAAVNLDMVGQDARRCGGPMIVEGSADHTATFLDAVATRALEGLPGTSASYSGAVRGRSWSWSRTPFVGASDHLLLADRFFGVPTLALGHWPDRFNHSSADTIDKVDPHELRRAATVAAATAVVAADPAHGRAPGLTRLVARWGSDQLALVARLGDEPEEPTSGVFDARSPAGLAGLLDHATATVVDAATRAAVASGESRAEHHRLVRLLRRQARNHRRLLPRLAPPHRGHRAGARHGVVRRAWSGPFNLRAVLEDAAPADAARLRDTLDGGRAAYASLVALAQAIDGRSSRPAVVRRAGRTSRLPIPDELADGFFDTLARIGWIEETPAGRRR